MNASISNSGPLEYFQFLFKKGLNQKSGVEFPQLLSQVQHEYGEMDESWLQEIELWFNKVAHFSFLSEVLANESIHEVIVHTPNDVQLVCGRTSTESKIDLLPEDLLLACEFLALSHRLQWSQLEPFQSFPCVLQQRRVRVTLLHPSLNEYGQTKLFIRTSYEQPKLDGLGLSEEVKELIDEGVAKKKIFLFRVQPLVEKQHF